MKETGLRRAEKKDVRFWYELRNEESVRKNSFSSEEIPYESHCMWFEKKRMQLDCHMYLYEVEGKPAGQARVDIEHRIGIISYAVAPEFRGKGHAKHMLELVEKSMRESGAVDELTGEVKKENLASQKVFEALDYTRQNAAFGYEYRKII